MPAYRRARPRGAPPMLHRRAVAYSAGTFTYQYDTAGRQSATTRPDGLAIKYAYDADGNDAAITYPDNYVYTYAYDELDRMTNVSETPSGSTTVTSLAQYAYDPLSRRTTLTYANGASTAYSYDAFSGLSQIAHTFANTGKLPTATFSYTRDNNERRVGDTVSNTAYLWHPPATATDSYTPNSLNQYTSINGKTLNYDPNGNLLGDPTAALGSTSYQFDQKNRLSAATNAQYTSTYTYDPFSRRASKTVNGVTTFFVDDGNREIADYSSPTFEISHYIYGADSTPILREVFSGLPTVQGSYWVHTDALGSLVAITNPNGSHTSTYNYSAFGEPNAVASASPYQYAGMRLDPETMLYYDHARYYSPKQGRFISPDPISVKGGVNIYAYAENDPINGVDTTGMLDYLCDDACGGNGSFGGGDGFSGGDDVGDQNSYGDGSPTNDGGSFAVGETEPITVYAQRPPTFGIGPWVSISTSGGNGGGREADETIVVTAKRKAKAPVPAVDKKNVCPGTGRIALPPGPPYDSSKPFTPTPGVLPGSQTVTAPDGTQFSAPPYADFKGAYAYGQSLAPIPTPLDAMGIKVGVGYGGIFDFQRSGNSFYGNYTYASNYAVGILMNGAHYSLGATKSIAAGFGSANSRQISNSAPQAWTNGWNAAASGACGGS